MTIKNFKVVPLGFGEWIKILAGLLAFYVLSLIFGMVMDRGE